MTRWPTEKHFTSWLTVAPHNKITGGRVISSRTLPSTNRAAATLRMAAMTLGRTQTALGAFYRRMAARLDKPQAITATARKLAILVYRSLKGELVYRDPGEAAYDSQQRTRVLRRLRHQATSLGFELVNRTTGEVLAAGVSCEADRVRARRKPDPTYEFTTVRLKPPCLNQAGCRRTLRTTRVRLKPDTRPREGAGMLRWKTALMLASSVAIVLVGLAQAQKGTNPAFKPPPLTPADYLQIRQLVARDSYAIDTGADDGAVYASLFAADGAFLDRTGRATTGRDNLAALARRNTRGRQSAFHESLRRAPPEAGPTTMRLARGGAAPASRFSAV